MQLTLLLIDRNCYKVSLGPMLSHTAVTFSHVTRFWILSDIQWELNPGKEILTSPRVKLRAPLKKSSSCP